MALIRSLNKIHPFYDESCWFAENAVIIGDVKMGKDCTVWYHAVIRGDVNSIVIGNQVNIQDHAMIHCTYKQAATSIGDSVSIGHRAIIHGCTLENNSLIGMGAIVMDHAVVGENSIVAAGAVVTEHTTVESGFIYAGIPAKKIKPVGDRAEMISRTAGNYVEYAKWYKHDQ
ncbi:MAG: gamma carbonic anhydrase family protein [Cyclobacteriaceae bacterium]